jgi:hypothetical protein
MYRSSFAELWSRDKVWWISALSGAAFGCFFRIAVDPRWDRWRFAGYAAAIVSFTFLAIVPLATGYISVRRYFSKMSPEIVPWYKWLFLPWASVLVSMIFFILVKWEGAICLLFASPIMLVFSLLGGIAARIFWGRWQKRSPGTLSAFALPMLLLVLEAQLPSPWEIRTVNTDILIHAPASVVWNNIKSVRAIAPHELPSSWVSRIGFPRPVAATLSHEGIGGVRQASFTGGLVFTETVNQWVPEDNLRFSIRANTESIPRTTLDEHVTIGGAFFDVLDGEYALEPRPNGILLHLSSHERLSTHLNPYAALWTDAVMRSIQNEILTVIRNRCESEAIPPP